MNLLKLAQITTGQLKGQSLDIEQISIDTRTLKTGDLYVAIIGERFDGHDFCQAAVENGASAVIVDRDMGLTIPQLIVQDTTKALGEIAKAHREQFAIPMFAVTGSCGKTTVKQMIYAIMQQAGNVFATKGNFNNHIGLPLMLLQLNGTHDFGVFELGANHIGEIRSNVALVEPNIAAITTIAPAHIEGFGSIENVSKAKSEIFEGLRQDGFAIAEADSPYLADWQKRFNHCHWLTFGLDQEADVYADHLKADDAGRYEFDLCHGTEKIKIRLPVMGPHNVKNATAAAAMAIAAKVPLEKVKLGLESMENVGGRLVMKTLANGAVVIDDSYNANPTSIRAAIDTITTMPKKRILVLGDMAELGPNAIQYHSEVGEYAKGAGIDALYAIGKYSEATTTAFGKDKSIVATSKQELIEKLKQELSGDTVCLIKGSRSAAMEDIVAGLIPQV